MDLIGVMKNVEFTDADRERILFLSPIVKENSGKIVDEVTAIVAEDKQVLDILKKNSVSAEDAKRIWMGALEMLFSESMNDKMIKKMFKIGITHVNSGVNEKLVIEAMSLFMLKTLNVMSNNMEMSKEIYAAVIKLFAVALSVMITSYSEEQERRRIALLKSLGISDRLLERLTEIGRKYDKS